MVAMTSVMPSFLVMRMMTIVNILNCAGDQDDDNINFVSD